MAALDVIDNEEIDEFDDTQLEEGTAPVAGVEAAEDADTNEGTASAPAAEAEEKVESDEEPGKFIPRHRYNFQRDQRLAAERQAQELQEQLRKHQQYIQYIQSQQQTQPQGPSVDEQLAEIDTKLEDARADGDTALVSKLRTQQRQLERQAVIEQMQASMPRQEQIDPRQLIQQSSESLRLEQLIGQLEQQYPMLDESHDSFDPDVSDEIMSLYDSLRQRMPLTQAMERAVSYVTKAHDINPANKAVPKRGNVERNIRAAAAQPPELSDVGMDSARAGATRPVDVAKMSQEQFEALDDAEIEKLLAKA